MTDELMKQARALLAMTAQFYVAHYKGESCTIPPAVILCRQGQVKMMPSTLCEICFESDAGKQALARMLADLFAKQQIDGAIAISETWFAELDAKQAEEHLASHKRVADRSDKFEALSAFVYASATDVDILVQRIDRGKLIDDVTTRPPASAISGNLIPEPREVH